jgi:methylisocitrate lyase
MKREGASMASFREMMKGGEVVIAPLALNPMSAVLAKQNGFKALYIGGGALGYLKCVTEANLSEPEFAQVALDIRTVCDLPLILDGACGWGDPMHMHRTIALAEAAGFAAIEIEDQILPKRAHHHAGLEHLIAMEDMVDKVREAAAARRNPDFVIIGRTNAARGYDFDEAMRRLEAYREAGADMLMSFSQNPDHIRMMGERLGPPLMQMVPIGAPLKSWRYSMDDLAALGYRLVVDSMTPLAVLHNAMKQCYASIAAGVRDPMVSDNPPGEVAALNTTVNLEALLEIERRTTEKPV